MCGTSLFNEKAALELRGRNVLDASLSFAPDFRVLKSAPCLGEIRQWTQAIQEDEGGKF